MKKALSFLLVLLAGMTAVFAQPQKMTYQAVVRNSNNELVANSTVGIRVTIVEDVPNGPIIYRETHVAQTNANGLVSIVIGTGVHPYTVNLSDVQWARHDHYFQVEIDPQGGTNYTVVGTQQLVSVPYSFHSGSAVVAGKSDTAAYAVNANIANTANTATMASMANTANMATYADTAYFLVNAQNSDTAKFAYNSDTAVYANTAYSSNISTTANYADSARISNYANSANIANSATSAQTANYSDSARIANTSNTANYANISGSASYSDSARIANSAISANYATTAGVAATAASATNSIYADTAYFLMNAQNSDTSKFAYHSDTANYANISNISNSAYYANSTKNANYADSSDYNHLVNRPLGNNTGDILYWNASDSSWSIVPVGHAGETLTLDTNNIPYWQASSIGGLSTLRTDSVINITTTTARVISTVTNDGGSAFVFSGVMVKELMT